MIGHGLRQLQEALNRKADGIQREFVAVGEQLKVVSRRMLERVDEREALAAEQETLHARQQMLAAEINLWRDRARAAVQQRTDEALRAYLSELLASDDETVRAAAQHVGYLLDAPEDELAKLAERPAVVRPSTLAGRLLERAGIEYDLRGANPAPRQRAAAEFANRPGMVQNEAAIAEIEAALDAPDPIVREVALLTTLQIHRLRALRLADLDAAHTSVKRLGSINHPSAIPILVEILENHRTGFVAGEGGTVEGDNARSRKVAMGRLVEWHTAEAQAAVRARQFDRDPAIARLAAQSLEFFPGEWTGPVESGPPVGASNSSSR